MDAAPAMHMHMHTSQTHDAPRGYQAPINPQHPAHDAAAAPQPTGLSQAELRRIVLDLLG